MSNHWTDRRSWMSLFWTRFLMKKVKKRNHFNLRDQCNHRRCNRCNRCNQCNHWHRVSENQREKQKENHRKDLVGVLSPAELNNSWNRPAGRKPCAQSMQINGKQRRKRNTTHCSSMKLGSWSSHHQGERSLAVDGLSRSSTTSTARSNGTKHVLSYKASLKSMASITMRSSRQWFDGSPYERSSV